MTSAFINTGLCGLTGAPIGWASPFATGPFYLFDPSADNLIAGSPNQAGFISENLLKAKTPAANQPDIFVMFAMQVNHGAGRSAEPSLGGEGGAIQRRARSFGSSAEAAMTGPTDTAGNVGQSARISALIREGRFGEVLLNAQSLTSEHILQLIAATKVDRHAAVWALAYFVRERPELFKAEHIPGMIDAAKVSVDAAWTLALLAKERPELFKAEYIPGMIGAAKVSVDVAWALAHLVENRLELFGAGHIPDMIDAAKVSVDVAGMLVYLAKKRPELAEHIIPGMIDAAKVNKGAVRAFLSIIKNNPNLLTRDHILSFCNGTANMLRTAFIKNIETFFFQRPDLFFPDVMEALRRSFASSPEFRYLEFYTAPQTPRPDLFPHQARFGELMAHGKRRVLVWHNIKDGMGDELIRNTTLIQALLDFNPELEVVICTGRPFLYTTALSGDGTSTSHPRVTARHISDTNNITSEESFDMVVHHYDRGQRYDDAIEERIQRFVREKGPKIYVRTNKSNDKFVYEKVVVDGRDVEMPHYEGNVYVPGYRLSVELGLPFRSGLQGDRHGERSFLVAHPNPIAEAWWQEHVVSVAGGRPVVLVNGFGGEGAYKGYPNDPEGRWAFADALVRFVAKGFFVVVLPNHQPHGTYRNALDVKNLLNSDVARYVAIAPPPVSDPSDESGLEASAPVRATLHKYFVSYADGVVTVEGGMMHLAYNIGQGFEAISMFCSGNFDQWFPAGASRTHGQSPSPCATGDGLRR